MKKRFFLPLILTFFSLLPSATPLCYTVCTYNVCNIVQCKKEIFYILSHKTAQSLILQLIHEYIQCPLAGTRPMYITIVYHFCRIINNYFIVIIICFQSHQIYYMLILPLNGKSIYAFFSFSPLSHSACKGWRAYVWESHFSPLKRYAKRSGACESSWKTRILLFSFSPGTVRERESGERETDRQIDRER